MLKTLAFTLTGVILLLGNPIFAQNPDDDTLRFKEADTDADGTLTKTEFKAYVNAKLPDFTQFDLLIERLDADKDGTISKTEFGNRRAVTQLLMDEAASANKPPVEFTDGFNARYAKRKPLVGDSLGDLIAFDENGNELDFASLKGKYTVVNFGCLT